MPQLRVGYIHLPRCFFESERGLFPNTEYVFDLELPSTFVPKNNDGEVDDFNLVSAREVLYMICDPSFKTTSCPVALDFLVRRGIVTPENGNYLFLL